jgi:hypothetical protein
MKHKHAELIKAWADGAKIEIKHPSNGSWWDANPPLWDLDYQYRIKPFLKPDWTKLVLIETHNLHICRWDEDRHNANLRLTFDGETGKLKSAEVI